MNQKNDLGCNDRQSKKIREKITEEEKQEIKEAFNLFGSEPTEMIEVKNLIKAMRALDFEPKKEEIKKILSEYDKCGEGIIRYNDFFDIMTQKMLERKPVENVQKGCILIPEEKQNKVSLEHLLKVAKELGENISNEELLEMIEDEKDGDGKIDQEDFIRIMKKLNLLQQLNIFYSNKINYYIAKLNI